MNIKSPIHMPLHELLDLVDSDPIEAIWADLEQGNGFQCIHGTIAHRLGYIAITQSYSSASNRNSGSNDTYWETNATLGMLVLAAEDHQIHWEQEE